MVRRRQMIVAVAAVGVLSSGGAAGLAPASATPVASPVVFTMAGCQTWQAPDGVSAIRVDATGAAGDSLTADLIGGTGDGMTTIVTGLAAGQQFDVCVAVGGGAAGGGLGSGHPGGGHGGGASGVSLGTDFGQPLVVAGGGGGYGAGNGGAAGLPVAGDGTTTFNPCGVDNEDGCPGHGGDNTLGAGGAPGIGDDAGATAGGATTATGPGTGGHGAPGGHFDGGGGGAGYYGGGGGGAGSYSGGGGGGGTDYCAGGTVAAVTISGCTQSAGAGTQTGAGADAGQAQVVITPLTTQTITFDTDPPAHPRIGETYPVSATGGGSGNPVTFTRNASSAGQCTVVNDGLDSATVSFIGHGTCAVFAHQDGDGQYAPAPATRQRIWVYRPAQSISYDTTPGHVRVGDNYLVAAHGGGSGNPVTFTRTSAGICSVADHGDSTASVSLIGHGTCVLWAHQQGGNGYAVAAPVRQRFHVFPAA